MTQEEITKFVESMDSKQQIIALKNAIAHILLEMDIDTISEIDENIGGEFGRINENK